ncbi:MAG: 50S ribosomal protein L39e [Candidatus Bathyarchaeia archaeon]
MARYKTLSKKIKLAKEFKKANPVPAWIIAKTRGRVRRTPTRRHWRRVKIKI